jgi:hypothetical protein
MSATAPDPELNPYAPPQAPLGETAAEAARRRTPYVHWRPGWGCGLLAALAALLSMAVALAVFG